MELRSETAWKKAAACEAHAKLTPDEILRVKFERLRDSWIRIANDAEAASAARNRFRVAVAGRQGADHRMVGMGELMIGTFDYRERISECAAVGGKGRQRSGQGALEGDGALLAPARDRDLSPVRKRAGFPSQNS